RRNWRTAPTQLTPRTGPTGRRRARSTPRPARPPRRRRRSGSSSTRVHGVPRRSAGILLYRFRDDQPELLLVHPGGPFWAKRDVDAWSIPKGEYDETE